MFSQLLDFDLFSPDRNFSKIVQLRNNTKRHDVRILLFIPLPLINPTTHQRQTYVGGIFPAKWLCNAQQVACSCIVYTSTVRSTCWFGASPRVAWISWLVVGVRNSIYKDIILFVERKLVRTELFVSSFLPLWNLKMNLLYRRYPIIVIIYCVGIRRKIFLHT